MLLGLIRPTQGNGRIQERDSEREREAILPHVGAMVESPAFYPILSGIDNLRVFARTAGNEDAGTIARVLAQVGLSERAHDKVKTYSPGMKQRAALPLAGPTVTISAGTTLVIIVMQVLLPLVAGSVALMGAVIGRSSVAGIVIGIAWFSIDSLLGGLFPLASLRNAAVFLQARSTGIAMASNGAIAPVHLPADLQGPVGLIPVAMVLFYLIVPITVAAIVFRKRDMLGAA